MEGHETDRLHQMGDVSVLYVGEEPRLPELDAGDRIDVTAARAASDARERLGHNGVDCVVARSDLPDTDGVEFLETVRERRPRLPLFLLAAEADPETVEAALEAGVTDCFDRTSETCQEELLARRVRDAVAARQISADDLVRETERLARTGGWHLDPVSGDFRVTPGCRRLHGLGDGPDSMNALTACYHPEDQQTLRTALIRAKEATDEVIVVTDEATIETIPTSEEAGGQVYLPELRLQPENTPDRVVETRIEAVTSDGDVVAIRGAVSDATDRQQREAEVRRYERVADDLPVGLFRATADGEFVSVNRTLVSLLGADSKVHLYDAGVEKLRAKDEDGGPERLVDLLDINEAVETDPIRIETLDGETRWVDLTLSPAERDGVEYVNGIVRDVTERTEREQRLEALRERMRFALEATDSYVYEVDFETGEETRYGPFERIHGVDPAAVPTMEAFYERCVHPADRERLRELESVETMLDRSGTVAFEYRTEREDGDIRWVSTDAFLRAGPDGDPEQLVGLSIDITEHKRREEQLEHQNERLEQFASVVSHDLREPLSVASGHLELLGEEHDSEHVKRALEAIDRSHSLVSDLLTLARDAETVNDVDPVTLATVVERTWQYIDATGANLVTETTQTLRAEPGLLRQLVTNLLRNAVEHGGEGITVTVGDLPDGGFYVADNGSGIPPEERDDIFESGYSTGQDNTGLGLAIVREIASAHGWQVAVTESEAGGAQFEIAGVETVSTDTNGIEGQLEQIDEQACDIYETLNHEPRSIPELAAEYDLLPSAVCPRLELLERHDLVKSRTRVADDGNAYPVYETTDVQESK